MIGIITSKLSIAFFIKGIEKKRQPFRVAFVIV
jgi:hypothetical protein